MGFEVRCVECGKIIEEYDGNPLIALHAEDLGLRCEECDIEHSLKAALGDNG